MAEQSSGYQPPSLGYAHHPPQTGYSHHPTTYQPSSAFLRKNSAPIIVYTASQSEPPQQVMRPESQAKESTRPASSAIDEEHEGDEEEEEEEEETEPLAFPGFVPVSFRIFKQTDLPRFWCLRLITYPYPF